MSEEHQARAPGSVPHAFGTALAWKWSRAMPRGCKGGFLTMLYALRALAAASGQIKFTGDNQPIRIQDIAQAAGCREKDGRRYIEAAIRAGVVTVEGERRRGKPTLYILVVSPWPDWTAADDYLKATARPRKADDGQPEPGSGHSGPNPRSSENGPQRPEPPGDLAEETPDTVRAAEARMGSGRRGPNGSGHRGPNIPGSTHGVSHEVADVVPQQPVPAGARKEDQIPGHPDEGTAETIRRCPCGIPLVRASRDVCHGCERAAQGTSAGHQKPVQGAFLVPVPSAPAPQPSRPALGPVEDPCDPERVCGCGRTYRAQEPGRCLDCKRAAHDEAVNA